MRLIDAYRVRCDRDDFDTYRDYITALDAINSAPTVKAKADVRSIWLSGDKNIICGNCKFIIPHGSKLPVELLRYCPNCGARNDNEIDLC